MRSTLNLNSEKKSTNHQLRHEQKQNWKVALYFFLIIVLGTLLSKGSIHAGFLLDDLIQRRVYLTHNLQLSLLRAFSFIDGSNLGWLIERGQIPWWSHVDLKISFFRPVTALTHYLDYVYWPKSSELMHLQSILWFLIVCSLVLFYYEKIFRSWKTALVAAFLFTADFNHYSPIAWLADRNRLIALFFGLLTLLTHRMWVNSSKSFYRFLALFLFFTTLLSAESGVAVLGFIVFYSVLLKRSDIKKLSLMVLDYIVVFIFWLVIYAALGYGVANTGLYINPVADPVRYLGLIIERIPILFIEQWLKPSMFVPRNLWSWPDPSLYSLIEAPDKYLYWTASIAAIFVLWKALHRILRKDEVAQYFIVSTFIALFFASTTKIIDGRLLIFVGLGTSGLVAQLLVLFFGKKKKQFTYFSICILILSVVLQGILSPIRLYNSMVQKYSFSDELEILTDFEKNAEGRSQFVINSPSMHYVAYAPFVRNSGSSTSAQYLVPGYNPILVKRVDENALQITILEKPEVKSYFNKLDPKKLYEDLELTFNKSDFPTEVSNFRVRNFYVEVLKSHNKSDSKIINFKFDEKLSSKSYIWYRWDWKKRKYEIFTIPKVGEEVIISAPN